MKIENILTVQEMATFAELLQEAAQSGAGAIRYWSEARGLIVVGLVSGGQLDTWFASPAANSAQAIAAMAVVLHGLQAASESLATQLCGANTIAADAVKRASKMN